MTNDTTNAPEATTPTHNGHTGRLSDEMRALVMKAASRYGTLSQSELFQRYLDAPVRDRATTSALVSDEGMMQDTTARERFLYHGNCGCLNESVHADFAEDILEHVENDESPLSELDVMFLELSNLVEALNAMRQDFNRVAEITRTEEPDEDAPQEIYDDWEENPRYLLPVIEPGEAA